MTDVVLVSILDPEGHPASRLVDLTKLAGGTPEEQDLLAAITRALKTDEPEVIDGDVQQETMDSKAIIDSWPATVRVVDEVTLYCE